ncbi:MAG: patatin-like phospholipase family protein [Chloroflexota bacterium]
MQVKNSEEILASVIAGRHNVEGTVVFRLSRNSDEVIGFALSGGGPRGASQVGALKALSEAGIRAAMVTGSSVGAINAAWYSLFPNRLDRLEALWMGLSRRDIFPGTPPRILLNLARRGYLHSSHSLERFLRRQIGDTTFEQCVIPCVVVAVRLSDGRLTLFDSGEIVPAVMASSSIPGVFPPYRIDDELYVDGGVLEYLPLRPLWERGVSEAYALDCSYFQIDADPEGVLDRCARISCQKSVDLETSLAATRGRKAHLLRPPLPETSDGRDFSASRELVQAGYSHATEYLRHAMGHAS